MKRILIALAAVAALPIAAMAQHEGHAHKAGEKCPVPVAGKKVVACPVMGEKFTPDATTVSSKYNGKTYQFCCPGCKGTFEKNPAKFAANAEKATPKKSAPPKKVTKKA